MSLSELNVCKFPYATVCVLTRVPGLVLGASPAGSCKRRTHTSLVVRLRDVFEEDDIYRPETKEEFLKTQCIYLLEYFSLHHTPSVHNRVDEQGCGLSTVFLCCDYREFCEIKQFSAIKKGALYKILIIFSKRLRHLTFYDKLYTGLREMAIKNLAIRKRASLQGSSR